MNNVIYTGKNNAKGKYGFTWEAGRTDSKLDIYRFVRERKAQQILIFNNEINASKRIALANDFYWMGVVVKELKRLEFIEEIALMSTAGNDYHYSDFFEYFEVSKETRTALRFHGDTAPLNPEFDRSELKLGSLIDRSDMAGAKAIMSEKFINEVMLSLEEGESLYASASLPVDDYSHLISYARDELGIDVLTID